MKFDTDRMSDIILCLIKNFGEDDLINYLLDRLIREESDSHVPPFKSTKVIELEKKFNLSLIGMSRNKIYNKKQEMSKLIELEHGLPESQAIKMFFEEPDKEKIKIILEDVKNNLVYITKEEHNLLPKKLRRVKGKNGYYWEETYKKCNIELKNNI